MFSFDVDKRAAALTDPASGRRWVVSPLGRHVLTVGHSGAVAVAMERAGPVLLQGPRPAFRWPDEFVIDDTESTVTVRDPGRRPGEPGSWTWHVPRRIVASVALPEPAGGAQAVGTTAPEDAGANVRGGTAVSPDGRFTATYQVGLEPGVVVEDAVTGESSYIAAGYYSRRWPVGGPWWSPDGEWLLCSWYSTKIFDHGWVSGITRESLDRHFVDGPEDALDWTMTGFPNGVPYPEHPDDIGSYEAISVAGFSADGSAVYFVDAHTVSGFSFPHLVPLFRVERPELTTVRHTVTIPGAGVPFTAWTGRDRLVVATRGGRVGSVWLDLGLSWIPEQETGSRLLAFDADALGRIALTDSGALLRWDVDAEPREIGSFPEFVGGPCAVGFVDPETIVAGGPGGDLLLIDRDGRVRSTIRTGLRDVISLQVSADGSHIAAVSSAAQYRKVKVADPPDEFPSPPTSGVVHAVFTDGIALMLIDSEDFLHLDPDEKRHVNQDGSLGHATAPGIAVLFMDEVYSGESAANGVLALACHPARGVAVATRSGLVGQFDPASEEAVTTHLGGDVAETLRFSPDGAVLMAAGTSAIHLLIPLA